MDSANSLFYKKVKSNISHGFTYSILLSTTSQQRPGCQWYGNQRLHNSMDLQPMTTILCRHSPLSPERKTCCILSVNQLLHACLLTKWKKCNIVSLFLQIHIVESTIPRRSSVPLSLQKGAAYGMLPICKAFVCLPFYKKSFHIPLQSPWGGTRPLSVSSSSILSFIQTYSILLSTTSQQRPGCQ